MTEFSISLEERIAIIASEIYGYRRVPRVNISGGKVYAGSAYVATINERRNEILFDQRGIEPRSYRLDGINPVVKTTGLRAYPGWVVKEYANRTFDAELVVGGVALSPGYKTFAEAVAFARNGGTVA